MLRCEDDGWCAARACGGWRVRVYVGGGLDSDDDGF